jgi:hypothetical protein
MDIGSYSQITNHDLTQFTHKKKKADFVAKAISKYP